VPTIALKVQQNGRIQGWNLIVGSTFAYQAVDDSDGTAHDSDTTYIRVAGAGLIFESPRGRASFPLFLQAEGLIPISITLNVVTKRSGASNPEMELGFCRGGLFAFDLTTWMPGASYGLESRTFSLNPITGAAWLASDLVGLEACVGNVVGASVGTNRLTLLSGSMDYLEAKYSRKEPYGMGPL
jgi:hypothetical protein